jgi:hypothetical protein
MNLPSEDYPVLRYFEWEHLRSDLLEVSRPFAVLAWEMANRLPVGAETAVCLRKLLEAKDAAVRSALDLAEAGAGAGAG